MNLLRCIKWGNLDVKFAKSLLMLMEAGIQQRLSGSPSLILLSFPLNYSPFSRQVFHGGSTFRAKSFIVWLYNSS